MKIAKRTGPGFTIVELLIVIVVIAILATISITAYNGIQQRAQNTAKFSTVASIVKVLKLYIASHQDYPLTTNVSTCLTQDNICTIYNGSVVTTPNSTLLTSLSEFGKMPPVSGDSTTNTMYGIYYYYNTALNIQGDPNPLLIIFWLKGTSQDCRKIGGTLSVQDTGVTNSMQLASASNGNTGSNQTRCYLMLPT
jgi:prepilin-type N-terminal cleavage/methylation domain-containing protein